MIPIIIIKEPSSFVSNGFMQMDTLLYRTSALAVQQKVMSFSHFTLWITETADNLESYRKKRVEKGTEEYYSNRKIKTYFYI
uniref:Uncharacterized protein n=1 Tax=Caenorhabditis tropicalis TaxID=1561998 RepID=A0A1I7UYA5_9PELO